MTTSQTKSSHTGIITCHICSETMSIPKVLPCSHTFCMACLQTYAEERKSNSGQIPCPLCFEEFQLPNRGSFSDLPTNYFIEKLVEKKRKKENYSTAREDTVSDLITSENTSLKIAYSDINTSSEVWQLSIENKCEDSRTGNEKDGGKKEFSCHQNGMVCSSCSESDSEKSELQKIGSLGNKNCVSNCGEDRMCDLDHDTVDETGQSDNGYSCNNCKNVCINAEKESICIRHPDEAMQISCLDCKSVLCLACFSSQGFQAHECNGLLKT